MSQEDRSLIDLDAIRTRAERAHQEISGLCNGSRRWTMRVPVTEEDSDMILSNLVTDVEVLCSALDAAHAEDTMTTTNDLRERLIAAELATKRFIAADGYPSFGVNTNEQAADQTLAVFAEHVTSDATVERVARALFSWLWVEGPGGESEAYDAARAALAAALAPEKEADRV